MIYRIRVDTETYSAGEVVMVKFRKVSFPLWKKNMHVCNIGLCRSDPYHQMIGVSQGAKKTCRVPVLTTKQKLDKMEAGRKIFNPPPKKNTEKQKQNK